MKMNLRSRVLNNLPSVSTVLRTLSLCVFLYSTFSVSISLVSVASFVVLMVSIYGLNTPDTDLLQRNQADNSLRGKPKLKTLSEERDREVGLSLSDLLTNYDPEDCSTLDEFLAIKDNSECVFARRARLWGSQAWDLRLSLEENACRSIPMFLKFTLVCQEIGLDGFLFTLPGAEFGTNVQSFGKAVRGVLQVLSNSDPAGMHCMNKSYVDKQGWVFEFNQVTFFVTTFAPFYPPTSSRYSHGAPDCFILLQPEISFAQHDLPPDTPHTHWEHPKTVRDRIRCAFRQAGRGYLIRDTVRYPMVHDIVKPVEEGGDLTHWWVRDSK